MLDLVMNLISNMMNHGSGGNNRSSVSHGNWSSVGHGNWGLDLGDNWSSGVDSGDGWSSKVSSVQSRVSSSVQTMVASSEEKLGVGFSSWGSIAAGNADAEHGLPPNINVIDRKISTKTYKSFHFDSGSFKH